jgi:predicted enzyme related to lactoylglutathione lyase
MFKAGSSFLVQYVKDVTATHNFYSDIGAVIEKIESDKVIVKLGDFEIHFVQQNTEPWEEYKYIAIDQSRGQGILFYVEVESTAEIRVKVEAAGGKVKTDIKENWWDGKEFLCEDPDGYKLVFYEM